MLAAGGRARRGMEVEVEVGGWTRGLVMTRRRMAVWLAQGIIFYWAWSVGDPKGPLPDVDWVAYH